MTLNIKNCLFKGTFTPGDGGKYHPIALKKATKTVSGNIIRAFYLNTASPSSGLGSNIIVRAQGFPLSTTNVDGEWDEPITATDGQEYYAAHFTGKRLPYSYSFEVGYHDNQAVINEGWDLVDFEGYPQGSSIVFQKKVDHTQYLISPEFDGYDALSLSFEYRGANEGITYTFQVGYSTTTKDILAFDWDDEITRTTSLSDPKHFYYYNRDFPGGVKYIAIKYNSSTEFLQMQNFSFKACLFLSPANLTLSKVADQEVTFTWKAPDAVLPITGYSYQYKKASDGSWSAEILTTSLSADLSGLTPHTDYNFRVRANYENGESEWRNVDFSTTPTLPYTYGFENVTDAYSVVDGWSLYNCYLNYLETTPLDITVYSGVRSHANRTGEKGFFFDNSLSYNPQYLISPCLPNTAPITLSFYYKDSEPQAHPEMFEKFRVGYSTTTNDVNAFTWGDETTVRGADWTEFKTTFPEGTRYIAVAYTNQILGLYIDDFTFEGYSSNPKPNNLVVSKLTNESATLGWEAPAASVTEYAYQYKMASETVWSNEVTTTATSATIGGLTANTTYDFRVKAVYSGGETSNDVTLRFMTEGPVVDHLPYTEGFENGMGGWRVMSGHVATKLNSQWQDYVHSGDYSFQFYKETNSDGQYLISPELDGKTPICVSFYYKDYPGAQTYFQVGYSTANKNSVEDFHWAERVKTNGSSNWYKYTAYCPEGTKYFAVRWCFGFYLYVDDFTFDTTITPTKPDNLAATEATATSANLSWTGNAGKFELKYREKPLFFEDFEGTLNPWQMADKTNNVFNYYTSWSAYFDDLQNSTWELESQRGNHVATACNQLTAIDLANNKIVDNSVLEVDDWLTLPSVDKVFLTGTLTFQARFYSAEPDNFEVLAGITADNATTYTTIGSVRSTTNYFEELENYYFDLSSFNGQEGNLIFRYKGKSGVSSELTIDNVAVYENGVGWTTIETTENNVKLTGLLPETDYELQVRSLLYNYSSDPVEASFTTEPIIPLAEDDDNSTTIAALADGHKHDVILQDFTLNRKRDEWNTLCLPFNVSDLSGTPLEGATVKELTAPTFSSGTLTLDFTEVTSIEAGKPYIIMWDKCADLVINNDNDWSSFAGRVNNGESFAGKTVALSHDINVSTATMVGTSAHPFCGTFDGNGYTLNLSIDNSDADYAAPFRCIQNATIRNVKTSGSVTGGQYCAGIVGAALGGTNSIRSCWMGADVTSQGNIGGVLGHGTTSATTVSGCYMSGTLTAQMIGVFYGGGYDGGTHTIENCWAMGRYNSTSLYDPDLLITDGGTETVTNCYKNTNEISQGANAYIFYNSQLVAILGNQWMTDDNGNLVLKPSTDVIATNVENPLFYGVTVSSSDPTAVTIPKGQFEGTYSPISDLTDVLLDANNAGNGAFHAAYSYDRSSLGEDFVGWYSDATLESPATVLPFDAGGKATLYAGMWMELADKSDNSETIASAVSSGRIHDRTVVLKDRTLYRDDDWNTLCLPFSMSIEQIAASPLVGVTIMELNGTTSNLTNGTLTLNFKEALSIEAGRPYLVKWMHPTVVISNTADWNSFASAVNNGTESYAGKLVKLDADIDVSTMVGTEAHPFRGTFDGNGHTLNLSIDDSDADYAAPFRYINGAFIRNVKVTGSVNGGSYCAGIVGAALGGLNSIRNCWMAASVNGPDYIGGILGHGTTSTTTISNCLLSGILHATYIGVFYGGGSEGGTHTVTTCWALGNYNIPVNAGDIDLLRSDGGTISVTNCRHNDNESRISQGSYSFIISTNDSPYANFLGSQWTTDGNGKLVLKPSAEFGNTVIESPKFTDVNISDGDPTPVTFTGGQFVGTYSPVALTVDDQRNLFLGADNTLYYPSAANNDDGKYYINACRAYFHIGNGATVREFRLNFGDEDTQGIKEIDDLTIDDLRFEADAWFTLDGRKLSGKPSQPGIYIHNDRKVVIRN